jgi:hypothetical protein
MTIGTTVRQAQPGKKAVYSVLKIERLRGAGTVPIAILLLDSAEDRLYMRFRDDLAEVADESELDVLELMPEMILQLSREEGGVKLFEKFADTLSGYVQMDEPRSLAYPHDWKHATDTLFTENVSAASRPPSKAVAHIPIPE